MAEHRIEDLVREINAATFSPTAHGEGHRIVYSPKESPRLYRRTLLERFTGGRDEKHYFVKHFLVPKQVSDWKFHWSEGTSAISLDFESSFVIQANEDVQALGLVQRLARTGTPGDSLYELINARLHAALEQFLRECKSRNTSLLDRFRRTNIGLGESEDLNENVSRAVTEALGNTVFRIGFQLKNAPLTQIEVETEDEFDLRDSKRRHKARTRALLKLVNYQAYKKSGLESEEDIRKSIKGAITQAVKDLLWGHEYYKVVRSFRDQRQPGDTAVPMSREEQLRARIGAEAEAIGYGITMFQTFPDIAALDLLEWKRIDMPGKRGFSLKNATSDVQIDIALRVRAEGNFENLHQLVSPDEVDAMVPITARVNQVCGDKLQLFTWEQFNLHFDDQIKPTLEAAVKQELRACGLATEIIRIAQAPTEDASRYKALRGKTTDFEVTVSPQANVGRADAVVIRGKVEVTGMQPLGWSSFESKDFGFRSDSRVTETRLRQLAQKRELLVSETGSLTTVERQELAIDLELLEIRDRVINTLQESLSKIRDLASSWRTLDSSKQITGWIQKNASDAISQEFGLSVALRGVVRANTDSETTALIEQGSANELTRRLLQQDVDRETALGQVRDKHVVDMVKHASEKDRDALDDEDHERHAEVRDATAGMLTVTAATPRLTRESAAKVLEQPTAGAAASQLPWLESPDASRDRDGAAP
jgi:hypothetical protein